MRLAKFLPDRSQSTPRVGLIQGDRIHALAVDDGPRGARIGSLLNASDAEARIKDALMRSDSDYPVTEVVLLAPIDDHEIWGAGVTYERSKVARQEESEQGGSFYDQVYRADRPELFFKATPSRVAGPFRPIRVRRDSIWSVPEPELALVLSPDLRLVGFTVGNDVSARDIEGRNPLYLPQAKVYDASCAVGPCVTLASALPAANALGIRLVIERGGSVAFDGSTSTARIARSFEDLVSWLGRENLFADGVILLTGTGIVPPDEFSLQGGDVVHISIDGIGTLTNPVVQGEPTV